MSRAHSRRFFLEVLGAAGGALVVSPLVGCSGGASEPNCNDTTGVDTAARQALHYTPNGTDAARHCSACQLYVGGQNGCGTCNAFPGPVSPQGTCDSFVPRA
ncbi:MAG: high-potential iron-sulfur protein [Sandaracinaceae bacterium]